MPLNRLRFLSASMLLTLVLAGCAGAATPVADQAAPVQPTAVPAVAATDTPLPAATAEPEPTEEPSPTAEPTAIETPVQVDPTAEPTAELSTAEMVAAAFSTAPTAAGEVILVTGRVLDLSGNPLPGAAVEFWQTDASGVYDHPGDQGTNSRDRGFQFYGTSITDSDGRYAFRTVRPGYYEPRPKHIHVKVKLDGRELLTTQFYFEEDRANLGSEGVFSQAGSQGGSLILTATDSVEMNGAPVAVLTNDLVIDTGSPGSLTATPLQTDGPYYPVVSVAEFDNDLAAVP